MVFPPVVQMRMSVSWKKSIGTANWELDERFWFARSAGEIEGEIMTKIVHGIVHGRGIIRVSSISRTES
jgi:hypothetical protein